VLPTLTPFFGRYKDISIDPQEYLTSVTSLKVTSEMSRFERSRYSTRQKTHLDCSGLVGPVTLHGEIGRLMPLILAGEVTGVGKNTVFGGGVYEVGEN
ncbi:MAG TPA: CRISPR system precrRNA processing endoribonuclease RAMP protein Cas6, partial [Chitinispirillaceae bacterium]|nr:CRISPR system precrRNA processing endoribonuclease RAMP protein Cas6 [Chitinispirillaceae bacterium]